MIKEIFRKIGAYGRVRETFSSSARITLALLGVMLVCLPTDRAQAIIPCNPASEQDWKTEYLDYVLSIRVVDSLDEAIDHINTYGSGHTDMIVSEDATAVERFMQRVDSGNVFSNCSTRFSDGFKYGFGAEVGISTNKLHARGPVGLEGLVTYKYKLFGHGQVAADYAEKRKQFTHRPIL